MYTRVYTTAIDFPCLTFLYLVQNLAALIEEISNLVKSISAPKKIYIALNFDNLIYLFGTEKMGLTLWLKQFNI